VGEAEGRRQRVEEAEDAGGAEDAIQNSKLSLLAPDFS
jgi:hypothetical protein